MDKYENISPDKYIYEKESNKKEDRVIEGRGFCHFENQVGGHSLILKQDKWLFKPINGKEAEIYEEITNLYPQMSPFIAEYNGIIGISSEESQIELDKFLREKTKNGDDKNKSKAKWVEILYKKRYKPVHNSKRQYIKLIAFYMQVEDLTHGKYTPAVLDIKLGNEVHNIAKIDRITQRIANSTSLELHFRISGMQVNQTIYIYIYI